MSDKDRKSGNKKKILFSIFMGMTVRNLVESGLLEVLLERYHIILYTPFANQSAFTSRFVGKDIEFFEPRIGKKRLLLASILNRIDYYRFWVQKRPETAAKYVQRDYYDKPFKTMLFHGLGLLSGFPVFKQIYSYLCSKVYEGFVPEDLLSDVTVVFTASTDVLEDRGLLFSASRKGIPTMALVHSWDNIAGRGYFSALPSRLLVWNEWMKTEATRLQGFPRDRIHVVGAPQFTMYRTIRPVERREFLNRRGIDPEAKVITYCASAWRVFPDEDKFIDWLIHCIQEQRFSHKSIALILRLHPSERREAYCEKYKDNPSVILDFPDSGFSASFNGNVGEKSGIQKFVDLLANSDLIVNLASTTTIDAAIFNCPALCPAFNFSIKANAWNIAAKWYQSEHYRALSSTQGFSIAYTAEQFIEVANRLLFDRNAMREGRRRIIKDFAPVIDTNQAVLKAVKDWIDAQ